MIEAKRSGEKSENSSRVWAALAALIKKKQPERLFVLISRGHGKCLFRRLLLYRPAVLKEAEKGAKLEAQVRCFPIHSSPSNGIFLMLNLKDIKVQARRLPSHANFISPTSKRSAIIDDVFDRKIEFFSPLSEAEEEKIPLTWQWFWLADNCCAAQG
jgi:hypothetical protein